MQDSTHFTAIVIGTGFAGAVTACRLAQAGVKVCVLERGRRYDRWDFPVHPEAEPAGPTNGNGSVQGRDRIQPDFSRLFWKTGQGLWDVRDLGEVVVAQAAGYGGGSLIYANVHLRAPEEVFDARWPEAYRGDALDPYYDLAAYMLGVEPVPETLPKTTQLERAAHRLGRADRFFRPPLAINFHALGDKKKRFWPNQFGREQGACRMLGECCFGCPRLAKNTLDRNYLALAEDAGAEIRTLAEVVSISRRKDGEPPGWLVEYRDHLVGTPRKLKPLTAENVFLCAGAVNSTELLMRSRSAGKLDCDAPRLGEGFYSNADALAMVFDCDELHELDRGPTITSALLYERDSDWLLVQEGGMPTALEPLLGLFRSPLWLSRNRFRENGSQSRTSSFQRTGYGALPFEVMTDAFTGMTRSAIQPRLPVAHEVGESLLSLARRERWSARRDQEGWSLLPDQMVEALEEIRTQLLDDVGVAAEPMVTRFLDEAAEKAERRFPMEELLKNLPPAKHLDLTGLAESQLARRILRLGLQLVWGSEGDLVRDIARQLLDDSFPQPDVLMQRVSGLLRWALDYRLGDGRTALLLTMGRDSKPGKLALALPEAPAAGDPVRGTTSKATGILAGAPQLESGRWTANDAAGVLVIAKIQGDFERNEILVSGSHALGVVEEEVALRNEALGPAVDGNGKGDSESVQRATAAVDLTALRFKPRKKEAGDAVSCPRSDDLRESYRQVEGVDCDESLRDALRAPLRAELPDAFAAPERATQERLLRDLAAEWGGELRTDPLSSFMHRRLTVHSLGGCGMGAQPEQGFTDATGQVVGCPGLYVMDAAAFPTSVGVNPSATIAAVAEYKVEAFIRKHLRDETWQAPDREKAAAWAEPRRAELDPFASMKPGSSKGPSAPTRARPVGIKFSERMTGSHHAIGDKQESYTQTWLHAEIEDLAAFLALHRQGEPQEIPVSGSVVVRDVSGLAPKLHVHPGSHMKLFVDAGSGNGKSETRKIVYRLLMGEKPFEQTAPGDPRYVLEGTKIIRDDERFDVWEDTTTLFFKISRKDAEKPFRSGILRLPAAAFFGEQLPSFEVTGTQDPARRSWALMAFGKFFLGHLVDVYLPEFGRVRDALRSVAERTHV